MSKSPPRRSLRIQIVLRTSLFTIAISLLLAFSLFKVSDNYVRSKTVQSAEFNLRLVASSIQRGLDYGDALLNWSCSNSTVRRYLSAKPLSGLRILSAYNAANNVFLSSPCQQRILRFLITDENDRFLQFGSQLSGSAALTTTTLSRFPFIGGAQPSGWQYLVTDPLLPPTHTSCLVAYAPIVNGLQHEHIGSVYLELGLEVITDPLHGYDLDPGCELYWGMDNRMWRINGETLTLQALDGWSFSEELDRYALDKDTKLYECTAPNAAGRSLLVVCPLDTEGLYIAQSLPESTFLAQRNAYIRLIVIGVVFVQLMSYVMLRWLNGNVSAPIALLQSRINAIGNGDFSSDQTIEWNNELGDIGRGINELSHNLDNLLTRRLADQRQNQEMEYRMLQNEVNPHFIYNTLNSIRWMATIQHAPGIAEMVTALSRLLKSVSKGTEKLVPLRDELALLNDYFTIQQYRYGGDLYMDVSYIEDEHICRDCRIPRFTLQPLAENAIYHGLEPRGGNGTVLLDIRTDGADVLVKITDDGVGMSAAQLATALHEPSADEAAEKFRHVGLWNVHRRLQYVFGAAYGLSLESEPGVGTTVTVRLPYHQKKEEL